MANSDKRMDLISTAVNRQAKEQADEIIRKAKRHRSRELARFQEELIDAMYETVQQQVGRSRQEMIEQISTTEREAYGTLHLRRLALCDEVFSDAAEELRAWTETEEYREWMREGIRSLPDDLDHSFSLVLLHESHTALQQEIAGLLKECRVEVSPEIRIGGFILENKAARRRFDHTLDTRLAHERGWFVQHCELKTQ